MAPSTRATPARNTRSRRQATTEAPEVPKGASTAYGSPGRPYSEAAEDEGLNGVPDLPAAMRGSRKTASPEKPVFGQPTRLSRPRGARNLTTRPTSASELAAILDEQDSFEPEVASSLVQEGTAIAPAARYDVRQAPAFASYAARRPGSATSSSSGLRVASRPWDVTVLYHTMPRYITDAINFAHRMVASKWALGLILLLLLSTLGSYLLSPKHPHAVSLRRARFTRGARLMLGMTEYEQPPSKYEQAWHYFRYHYMAVSDTMPEFTVPETQWVYNVQFTKRLEAIETRFSKLEETVASLTDQIRDELPKMTIVQVEDGDFVIPDGFWMALHGKMTGDESLWTAFHKANEANLQEYTQNLVENQLALGEKRSTVVGRAMLEDIIRGNYDNFLKEFRGKMDGRHTDLVNEVRKIASQVAEDLIARHTSGSIPASERAANRAGAEYLSNNVDELHSVNYFSPYHGAQVDYRWTSPTALRKQPTWLAQWYASWGQQPNKPHTALRAWNEVTESWCAAKSDSPGKAQLAVITKQFISPVELVIEHIPRGGTLEIANAPREIEMWMHVGNEQVLTQIKNTVRDEVPAWEQIECGDPPGPDFYCAARGNYDIHDDNWVQSIPAIRVLNQFGVRSHRFIIRALSNWGGDHTCFYRLRLKGQE